MAEAKNRKKTTGLIMSGWIKIHRKLSKNTLWTLEPFTRGQAWIDLILLANHKNGYILVRGNKIDIKRGQIGWSELRLSERWKWSRSKVRTFFKLLESEQQIIQQKNKLSSIISIVNYDEYQKQDNRPYNKETTDRTTEGQQKDTNKKNKEENKKNKEIIPPNFLDVQNYCIERKNGIDPQNFIDSYEAKGWMIGKNKMKSWKAAVRTWEKNNYNQGSQQDNFAFLRR